MNIRIVIITSSERLSLMPVSNAKMFSKAEELTIGGTVVQILVDHTLDWYDRIVRSPWWMLTL